MILPSGKSCNRLHGQILEAERDGEGLDEGEEEEYEEEDGGGRETIIRGGG